MSIAIKVFGLMAATLAAMIINLCPAWAEDEQPVLVGRVYDVEGDLLRYVPEDNDWVAVVKDAPVAAEDTFYSGNNGMAELISPNGSWVRIGDNTQIQFLSLDADLTEMDMAVGMARFYNKGTDTIIKATSPFGYVQADPGTIFDFYVGENSVEVVAIKGTVSFVQSSTEEKYDVPEGSPSIIADQDTVSSGEGVVDEDWDDWNSSRDDYWSKKNVKGPSSEYLPPDLAYDSDVLDENGEWVFLPYEGQDYWFWRPTRVSIGWSPFTMGVWAVWGGDETWIPAEPFGYVTHHYGNWVYIRNRWCWAPPVVSVRIGRPLLDVSFWWCPGRVSWIHRGVYVGWVPLAPREIYYSHRHWGGRHARRVQDQNVTEININITNYTYVNHAVIVKQDRFHGVDNYRNHRVTNVNRAVIRSYKAAPVINNTVIRNYTDNKQRHSFANKTVSEKPHSVVVNRIRHNESVMRQERKEKASEIQQQVKNAREGKVNRNVKIEAPKATNYIVPSSETNRPKSEIKFQQKEIKFRGRSAQGERTRTDQQPTQQRERTITPSQPDQTQKPAVQPGRTVVPATPGRQETPAIQQQPSRAVTPSKPEEQEKPAVRPGRTVAPTTPNRQETPAVQQQPGRTITPTTPGQLEKKEVNPGRVTTPSKPDQPETPSVEKNRVTTPTSPSQSRTPAVQPNRVTTPSQPSQQQTPAVQPNRVNVPSAPAERGIERLKRTEKSESSEKKGTLQDKVREGKTKESTEKEEDKEIQR